MLEELEVTIEDEEVVKAVTWDYSREIPSANDCVGARNQCLVAQFGSYAQHKGYLCHLRNSFLDGDNKYPTTVHEAYNILCRREEDNPQCASENDGVSFAQTRQQKDLSNIHCDSYNHMGQYANSLKCPNHNSTRATNMPTPRAIRMGQAVDHIVGKE